MAETEVVIYMADVRCHELLNEIYNEPKRGVEIGVYRGALSWRLLASNRNLSLHMVDPWREVGDGDSWRTTDDKIARYQQEEHNAAMALALQETAPFADRREVMRMTSAEAAPHFADESLDFVFVDADHSYAGCKSDIALWWPKVRRGGLLSGHDYRPDKGFGVMQAVDEFVSRETLALRRGGNHTWFVSKSR